MRPLPGNDAWQRPYGITATGRTDLAGKSTLLNLAGGWTGRPRAELDIRC